MREVRWWPFPEWRRSLSLGLACEALGLACGAAALQRYMDSVRGRGFHIEDHEKSLHSAVEVQYRNWFEPAGAVEFLRLLRDRPPIHAADAELLLGWMGGPRRNARIGGDLPANTPVAHKSGSSETVNGLSFATNEIGLITLPDGPKLPLAVFLKDSRADSAVRDRVIAQVARAAYDAVMKAGRWWE